MNHCISNFLPTFLSSADPPSLNFRHIFTLLFILLLILGKEFFVGLSSRTNEGGAKAVAAAFPEYPVTPIKVSTGLHLKSSMTMAGPDIICVGASKGAQEVLRVCVML